MPESGTATARFDSYLKTLSPMKAGMTKKVMAQLIRLSDGTIISRREWIEKKASSGGKIGTSKTRLRNKEEELERQIEIMKRDVPANENHPTYKRYMEMVSELKKGIFTEELHIEMPDGKMNTVSKTEADYFNFLLIREGTQGTAPGQHERINKIIEDVKKKPLSAPEKRDEIRRELTAQAGSIDRSAITELRNFRPLGIMSEFGLAMGAEPRKGVKIDTPFGPYVFDEKRVPSKERVDRWYAQHKEAEGIRTLAAEYAFGLGASPNTVTGNFRVVERGRRFKEQGMLSPEEEQALNALEKYWQEHPEFDRQKGYGVWGHNLEIMVPESLRKNMIEKKGSLIDAILKSGPGEVIPIEYKDVPLGKRILLPSNITGSEIQRRGDLIVVAVQVDRDIVAYLYVQKGSQLIQIRPIPWQKTQVKPGESVNTPEYNMWVERIKKEAPEYLPELEIFTQAGIRAGDTIIHKTAKYTAVVDKVYKNGNADITVTEAKGIPEWEKSIKEGFPIKTTVKGADIDRYFEKVAIKSTEAKQPWEMTRSEAIAEAAKPLGPMGISWGEMRTALSTSRQSAESLHKDMVKLAIVERKPVPAEVLKEYPDLVTKKKEPWEMTYREFADFFIDVWGEQKFTFAERVGKPMGIQSRAGEPYHMIKGKRIGYSGSLDRDRWRLAIVDKALSEGKKVPEEVLAELSESLKHEREKLGGTGMAEQYEEKPPGQEVRDWMKRALGIEDYKGGRHDRIQMLALLIQNSELGNIRSISDSGSMALALGKDLGYGTPPAYGMSLERYYAEKIAAETGKEVPIIKSSAIIKPPAKELDVQTIFNRYTAGYSRLSLVAVTQLSDIKLAEDITSAIPELSKEDALKIAPQIRALADAKAKEMEAQEVKAVPTAPEVPKVDFWGMVKDLKITDVQVEFSPGEPSRGYKNIYLYTYALLENGKRVRMNEEMFKGRDMAEAQKMGEEQFRQRKLYMIGETVEKNVRESSFLFLNRYEEYVKQVPVAVQKRFEESGAIAGGTPARHILRVTEPEGYYFGTQIEVLQGANPELEPYFTGTIKRLLNNGELVEVHPEGDPREVSFRVPVDRVNVIRLVQQGEPKKIKELSRYYYSHRPPGIGTQPEGYINYESWLPAATTPHGRTAFGWVEYDRPLTPEEISGYELFEDEVELPKLVKELVQFARDEGIDEAMKAIDAEYGRAVWDWLKAQKRIRAGLGQKEQIRDEIIRLAGITAPKDKFAEIQDQMQRDKDKIIAESLYKRYTSGYSTVSLLGIVQQDTKDLAHSIGYELKLDTAIYTPAVLLPIAEKFKEYAQRDYNVEHEKHEKARLKEQAEKEKERQEGGQAFWDEVKDLKVVDFEVQHDVNPDKPTRTYFHVYDRSFAILENGKKVQVSYVIYKGEDGKRALKATKEFYMRIYGQYMGKPLSEWITYDQLMTGNRYEDYKAQQPKPRFTFIPEALPAAPPAVPASTEELNRKFGELVGKAKTMWIIRDLQGWIDRYNDPRRSREDTILDLESLIKTMEMKQKNVEMMYNSYVSSTMLTQGVLASPQFMSDEKIALDIERNIQVSRDEARALVPQFRAIAEKRINKEEVESVKELFGIDVEQEAHKLGIDLADYAIIKAGSRVFLQHKIQVQRQYEIKSPAGFMKKREEETQERLREAERRKALTVPPAAPPAAKPAQSIQEVKQQVMNSIQAARSVEELQPVLKGIGFLPLPEPEKQQVMDAYQNRYSILMSERPFGVPVKGEEKPKAIGAPTPQQLFEAELRRKAGEARRAPTLTGGVVTSRKLEMFEPGAMEKAKAEAEVRTRIEQLGLPYEVHPYIRKLAAGTQDVMKFGAKRGRETVDDLVLARYVRYCPPGTIIDNRSMPSVPERWWVYPPKLRACMSDIEKKLAEAGAGMVKENIQPALTESMRNYIRGAVSIRDVIHYFRDGRLPIRGVLYRTRDRGYFVEAQDGQIYDSMGWEEVGAQPQCIREPARYAGARAARGY